MGINLFNKVVFALSVFVLLFLATPTEAVAVVDPIKHENNRFGIHIMDENDLEDAANLVNSNGGDWGYVTIVIRSDERKIDRWQGVFDKMRRLRLIPIVRIASKQENSHWQKLSEDDINSWIYFLNSLNWVTQNRYIVVGNEPNHATEWGGEISPQEYASYLVEFSKRAKNASEDFFILPAGLDASAPDLNNHMDEERFLRLMLEEEPSLFAHIDGWTSHSYPNPGFSGSENDSGRGSVRTYEWELDLLKSLGLETELPVFITETGWVHDINGEKSGTGIRETEEIGDGFLSAFQNAWNNKQVVAITPFILNYQGEPFDTFSWKSKDGKFYDFYFDVQNIPKKQGKPKQITSGKIKAIITPKVIRRKGNFYGLAYVENTGQSIWEKGKISLIQEAGEDLVIEPMNMFSDIEPGGNGVIFFKGKDNLETSASLINGSIKLSDANGAFSESFRINIQIESIHEKKSDNNSGFLIFKHLLDKISSLVFNEISASV